MNLRLCVLVSALASGCAAKFFPPTELDVARVKDKWPDLTLAQLQEGQQIFKARCHKCHGLRAADHEPPGDWPHVLNTMAKKAKLTPEERAHVERYLVTMSDRPQDQPGPPAE